MSGSASMPGAGRPKAKDSFMALFLQAKAEVEIAKKKSLLVHFIERAFKNDKVLIACIDRILPALKAIEISGGDFRDSMSEEMIAQIQKKLSDRFSGSGSK